MAITQHNRKRGDTELSFLSKFKAFKNKHKLTNGKISSMMRERYKGTPPPETIRRWENEKYKTPMGWDIIGHLERFMIDYEQDA